MNRKLLHFLRSAFGKGRKAYRPLESERATALLEFVVAAPFLMTLAFGAVDIEQGLRQHFALEAAIQEVGQQAMFMPLLPGGGVYSTQMPDCPGGYDSTHALLHQEMLKLILSQDSKLTDTCITTELKDDGTEQTVQIKVRSKLHSLSPLFNGIPISAEMEVPYLLGH
jgi:hypothetical protein